MMEIASKLGRSRSSIYQELKRNEAPPEEYGPYDTEEGAPSRVCIGSGSVECVRRLLCDYYWTPEQIAAHLRYRQKELREMKRFIAGFIKRIKSKTS